MSTRRPLYALLVTGTAAGLVLSGGTPVSAGGATEKSYKASAKSDGAVVTPGLGSLTFVDRLDGDHPDRVSGNATRTETITITTPTRHEKCKDGYVIFYGLAQDATGAWTSGDWSNVQANVQQRGRMRLDCTFSDGTKHRFHWGMSTLTGDGGASDPSRTNCLTLFRTTASGVNPTEYTVATLNPITMAQCPARHDVLTKAGFTSGVYEEGLQIPFTATFTVSGAVPVV